MVAFENLQLISAIASCKAYYVGDLMCKQGQTVNGEEVYPTFVPEMQWTFFMNGQNGCINGEFQCYHVAIVSDVGLNTLS